MIRTGIITVGSISSSAAFRSAAGPALRESVAGLGWNLMAEAIVPDDFDRIAAAVVDFSRLGCQLILTAGGTGISPQDVTLEAVLSVARREIPGFREAMRMHSSPMPNTFHPRGLGAVVGNSLVITLPGCASTAAELLGLMADTVPCTIKLLEENPVEC